MNVKITADSTCDLSEKLLEKYRVDTVPLYVMLNDQSYRDGIGIAPDDIFRFVESGGSIATTSAANVQDYAEFFGRQLESCDGLVHFSISSEISSSYQNACLAAGEYENVFVIDSRSLSTGIGLLVLEAAEMALEGRTAKEIAAAVDERKSLLDVSFVINTLEYLRKGGRCSALVAMGANLLNLKPCIEMRGGKMSVGKKYRGQLERCMVKYVEDKLSDPSTIDDARVFITDSGVSEELRSTVRETVLRCVPFKEVIHTRAGCTISNHCGPECLGILFFRK